MTQTAEENLREQYTNKFVPAVVLVAVATSNVGGALVKQLSESGKVQIKAGVRNDEDDDRWEDFALLENVQVVKLDYDDLKTVKKALFDVDRAFLVSAPFSEAHFDRETNFLGCAKEMGVPVVRISSYTGLMSAGTKCTYARAHTCIEAYAKENDVHVVNLRPNWFFDNLLFGAEEIKGAGRITYPAKGDIVKNAFIAPEDVADAAAAILMAPGRKFEKFVNEGVIEVHGPERLNLDQNLKILSDALGYEISIHTVEPELWTEVMTGFGMEAVHAASFCSTIQMIAGEKECLKERTNDTSSLFKQIDWEPKITCEMWAKSPKIQSILSRDDGIVES